jgi:hypothetical protein
VFRPRSGRRESSPAIYRWGCVWCDQMSPRSGRLSPEGPALSAVRFTDYFVSLDLIPALKCWAILISSASRTKPISDIAARNFKLTGILFRAEVVSEKQSQRTFLDVGPHIVDVCFD